MTLLRTVFPRVLDAVFPAQCFGCRAYGRFLCDSCLAGSARSGDAHPRLFRDVRSVFRYDAGLIRNTVLALKFNGISAATREMAAQMSVVLAEWSPEIDVVVPVPLGWARRRTRGYNQSELLAREVARTARLPIEPRALRRRRATRAQARQPDAAARLRNVRDAFEPGSRRVSGNVLLVDDVTTTGATLDACARTLLTAGAGRVYGLTFAREG